jgi:hypothetical protein
VNYIDRATSPLVSKISANLCVRGCNMVSATYLHSHILGFLDRCHYFFFQVAPQLYSWDWVDPIPDPLLLRKSDSAGNRTRALWIATRNSPLDQRDSLLSSTFHHQGVESLLPSESSYILLPTYNGNKNTTSEISLNANEFLSLKLPTQGLT